VLCIQRRGCRRRRCAHREDEGAAKIVAAVDGEAAVAGDVAADGVAAEDGEAADDGGTGDDDEAAIQREAQPWWLLKSFAAPRQRIYPLIPCFTAVGTDVRKTDN